MTEMLAFFCPSSFSCLPQSFFSLAHSGMLIMWKNAPQHIRPPDLTLPKAQPHLEQRTNRIKRKHRVKKINQGGFLQH